MKISKSKNSMKEKMGLSGWIVFCFLTFYTLVMFLLVLWALSTTLKTRSNFMTDTVGIPKGAPWEWAWSNYLTVFKNFELPIKTNGQQIYVSIWMQFVYSLLYAGGSALTCTFCCCLMGYLNAKFKYAFSEAVYVFVIIAMVVPIIGSTPSMLLLLRTTGLYDTYLGMWLMKFNFGGLYFLVFHATYKGISNDYSEAATVDGAGEVLIFFRIMLPMVVPTFATICLLQFIEYWNDYNFALMYMPTHPTIAYGVYKMSRTNLEGMSTPPFRLAACFIMMIPILTVFIIFRNKIMGNVTMGGVKE